MKHPDLLTLTEHFKNTPKPVVHGQYITIYITLPNNKYYAISKIICKKDIVYQCEIRKGTQHGSSSLLCGYTIQENYSVYGPYICGHTDDDSYLKIHI